MKALEDTVEKLNKDLVKNAAVTKKAGRAAATASGNVQRLGIAFRTTLAPITAIVGGLALLSKALNTTGSRGAELNVISTSLRGLVDDSDAAAEALLGVADKLGKATLFDEEDFTATFKLFTSFRNIGVDSYERVGEAAADIATKLGTAPKDAALQLAKALEDPAKQVTALARSGTVFTEQQKEQIKALQASGDLLGAQEIILKEIEAQYGGAAKAAGAAGFAGALDSLGESWRDFLEVLGQSTENSAVAFLNEIAKGLDFVRENFDVISAAATAAIDVIVQPFVAIFEGIQMVTGPVDDFREKYRSTLAVITKLLNDLTNNVLKPVFKFIGFLIAKIIQWLGQLLTAVGKAAVGAVKGIVGALDTIAGAIEAFINSTPAGLLSKLFGIDAGGAAASGIRTFAAGIQSLADNVNSYADELRAAAVAANELADAQPKNTINPFKGAGPKGAINQPGQKGGAGKATKGLTDAEKALAKQLKEQQKLVDLVNKAYERRQDAITSLEDEIAYLKNAVKYGEEYAQKFREVQRLVMEGVGFNEAFDLVTQRDALQKQVDEANNLNNELTETEELLKGAYEIIAGELTGAIEGLVKGTADWGDVLSSILSQLGSMFLNAGVNGLGNALFPPKASGGVVEPNKPYLVGERGPEIMMPSSAGRVVSNADTRAALDRYTPMGAASYSSNVSITTGPVMQMNNDQYIRRDDFERGLRQATQDGAKQGEAMALKRLKNSRSTRATLGM